MAEVMEGRAAPAHIAGFLDRPCDEGRAARRNRRSCANDARARGAAVATPTIGLRYVRHRRRPVGHLQYLVVRGARRRGVRRSRCQARQPVDVEPVRQRRCVRGARRSGHGAACGCRAVPSGSRDRLFLRADVSSFDAICGAIRRELGVRTAFNLLGPLTNPAGAARQLVGVPQPNSPNCSRGR